MQNCSLKYCSVKLRLSTRNNLPRLSFMTRSSATLLIFMAGLYTSSSLPVPAQEKSSSSVKSSLSTLNEMQDAFAAIAEELEPAVCTVFSSHAPRSGDGSSKSSRKRAPVTGSGVVISKDGWILTNDHVVDGADRVTVKLHDGREFMGEVRRDYHSDLALVKITSSTPFPAARLGDSDKLKIGHWAIAIGSPYRYEGSFSVGVVSSMFRRQEVFDFNSPNQGRFYPNMIQTDAAINPGNSGGPLCNISGEVIGINTTIESEAGGSVGIGFAIPINSAKFVVSQLLEKGRVSYGYLGVSPTDVTPKMASVLRVERGALIERDPEPSSPGAKSGLQAGDVVVSINNHSVRNELDLRTLVAQTIPGTTVKINYVRDGIPGNIQVTLGEAPEIPIEKPHTLGTAQLGIEVQSLSDKLADQYRIPQKLQGVAVKAIDPDCDAADKLMVGAVIIKINDTEVPTVQAFHAVVASLKSGDLIRIRYQVGKDRRFALVSVN